MKRLDLIIDALDRVDTFDWNQQDNKLIKDARIAARELRELEPVAWATFDGEGSYDFMSYEHNETYRDEYIKRNGDKYANWVKPLYALGDEK